MVIIMYGENKNFKNSTLKVKKTSEGIPDFIIDANGNNEFNSVLNIKNDDINLINHDLSTLKEDIINNQEYFLLEIESSFDKNNLIQTKNENKISELSEEIGKNKQIIDEKNKMINNFQEKESDYINQISSLKHEIKTISLNNDDKINRIIEEKNGEIRSIKKDKDGQISKLNEWINKISTDYDDKLSRIIEEKNGEIRSIKKDKDGQISKLNERINEVSTDYEGRLSRIIEEKDGEIRSIKKDKDGQISKLNEEIIVVSTDYEGQIKIIEEKDDQISKLNERINEVSTDYEGKLNRIIEEKKSEIEYLESNLVVKEINIIDLKNELKNVNDKFHSVSNELQDSKIEFDNKLNLLTKERNIEKERYLHDLKQQEISHEKNLNALKNDLTQQKNDDFSQIQKEFDNEINNKNSHIQELNNEINNKNSHIQQNAEIIKIKQQELKDNKRKLNYFEHSLNKQSSIIESKNYLITSSQEEIFNNHLEIEYLKNKSFTKTIFSPLSYLYLFFKSNPKEIYINIKLYCALKNSKYFDIGFYLNNNNDLPNSKLCKFFSPELHYVCHGFNEKRKFNKKYFNIDSKKKLLDYLNKIR